jgi:hypothetical protein
VDKQERKQTKNRKMHQTEIFAFKQDCIKISVDLQISKSRGSSAGEATGCLLHIGGFWIRQSVW